MSDIKYIKSLTIEKRDGQLISIPAGNVMITGGVFMDASIDASDNSVSLSAGPEKGTVNQDMLDKYNALINGGGDGNPYYFSGAPYYYSEIAGAIPIKGHAFLTAKLSTHIGLFEDGTHPTSYNQDPIPGELEITDVNRPCVDCAEYTNLYRYMDAVRYAIDEKKEILYRNQEQQMDSDQQLNALKLDKQLFLYWNNTVQKTAWRCHAIADGAEINAACMFTNHFNMPLASGTYFRITLTGMAFYVDDQSGALPPPMSDFIDHAVPSGWVEDVDYELNRYPEGRSVIHDATWSADFATHTVTITTPSIPGELDPVIGEGSLLYVTNIEPPGTFGSGSYTVLGGDFHSFTLSVPDMQASGASHGTLRWGQLVTLELLLNTPLPPEESIRFYIGAYSSAYKGSRGKVNVVFGNNIGETAGADGYPDTREVITNNMVVVTNKLTVGDS